MIRRFNYTGRRRISREDARVSIRSRDSGPPLFSASLSLERYKLPPNALIFLEAYRLSTFMRFPWGTTGNPMSPPHRALTEFGTADGVLFRVKIVEASDSSSLLPARLLAMADQLRPQHIAEESGSRPSLLDVMPNPDLDEMWRVEFSGGGRPVLQVKSDLDANFREIVRHESFVTLVAPEILRVILTRILRIDGFDSTDDADSWESSWLRFTRTLPGVGDAPQLVEGNDDDLEEWINGAVAGFARKSHIDQTFNIFWNRGEIS